MGGGVDRAPVDDEEEMVLKRDEVVTDPQRSHGIPWLVKMGDEAGDQQDGMGALKRRAISFLPLLDLLEPNAFQPCDWPYVCAVVSCDEGKDGRRR